MIFYKLFFNINLSSRGMGGFFQFRKNPRGLILSWRIFFYHLGPSMTSSLVFRGPNIGKTTPAWTTGRTVGGSATGHDLVMQLLRNDLNLEPRSPPFSLRYTIILTSKCSGFLYRGKLVRHHNPFAP